jgi:hypothetical protein
VAKGPIWPVLKGQLPVVSVARTFGKAKGFSMKKTLILVILSGVLSGCASQSKILVNHDFRGKEKTSKILVELSGERVGKKQLYNTYIRMCDLKGNKESNCNETMVLSNVLLDDIY